MVEEKTIMEYVGIDYLIEEMLEAQSKTAMTPAYIAVRLRSAWLYGYCARHRESQKELGDLTRKVKKYERALDFLRDRGILATIDFDRNI
jgi:hypothetical protein